VGEPPKAARENRVRRAHLSSAEQAILPTLPTATPLSEAEAAALFADLARCPALVLAVSGGPDSTALLVLAARWRGQLKQGPKLLAVTVDHGLRRESAAEARAVRALARTLGVAHRTIRWRGRKPSSGIQEAAREARYALLAGAARKAGARHILTGHTRDDQAETVLFRLARGSGLTGLAGMARMAPLPADPEGGITLVRPFLDTPKARLIAALRAVKIPFSQDPSNADPRFARARLRKAMPLLAAEGLDVARLARLAARAARAEAAIEAAVTAAEKRVRPTESTKSASIMLVRDRFAELPAEVALRLLGRAIAQVGDEGPVELAKLEALFEAIQEGFDRGPSRYGRFRRTLAGALLTVTEDAIMVTRAPARRRHGS
jgi:tRNA(Ile)-lysidine synthase